MCSANGMFEVTRSCVNVNNCLDNDCGEHGVCVDLPNPVGNESVNHYECNCHYGYVEVLTETMKSCENPNGTKVCEDDLQRYMCECVGTSSCDPGTCSNHADSFSCACPTGYKIGASDKGETCEVELCGVASAVEHSMCNDTSKIVFGKAVEYTCDTGYSVDGKVGGPSKWVTTCLAGGTFSENLVCKPTS